MTTQLPHYQVAIAGGGVSGLTLSLIFEKLNISYVLLEARSSLQPPQGAGVGLQPNGTRILDQLGLLKDVEDVTHPLSTWFSLEADGELISDSSAMGKYLSKIGYPVSFIERRQLIRILAEHVQRKDCIHTSSRVTDIKEFDDYVEVTTNNGHRITADLLLGSDGVNSAVRKFVDSECGVENGASEDIVSSFSTVYGMSKPTKGIETGERFAVYREHENLIGFTGKDVVFWFVFAHLDKKYPLSDTPRFTEEDSNALCESMADIKVTPNLRFGDLYANKTASLMVPIEEGLATNWHTSRTALLGDAACKMTPAGGQGANQAIECCVVLVNELRKAQESLNGGKLSRDDLRAVLERYSEKRLETAKVQLQRSQMVLQALFCYPGPPSGFRKSLASMTDEAWLQRAFTALASAPVLDGFELSERGHLYNKTCQEALAASQAAEAAKKAEATSPVQKPGSAPAPIKASAPVQEAPIATPESPIATQEGHWQQRATTTVR